MCFMHRAVLSIVGALVVAAAACQARAETYTFTFAGTITQAANNGPIHWGDSFTGWFAYADTMPLYREEAQRAIYEQNPAGELRLSVSVGGTSYTTVADNVYMLQVFNDFHDWGWPWFDGFFLSGMQPSGYGLDLYLTDPSESTLSTTAIPDPSCITLQNFSHNPNVYITGVDSQQTYWSARGAITSLTYVPEPSTLLLAAGGLAGLLACSRRRRR
jgi:hypothetical protein